MSQQPEQKPDFFQKLRTDLETEIGHIKDDFKASQNDLREMGQTARGMASDLGDGFVAQIANPARTRINQARRATADASKVFVDKVGKDRLKGAAVGAKFGSLLGARTLHVGPIAAGAVVFGTLGFFLGRPFYEWLDGEKPPANENTPPAGAPAPPETAAAPGEETPRRKPGAFPVPPEV